MGAVVPVRQIACPRCAGANEACAEVEDIEEDDVDSEVSVEDNDGSVCKAATGVPAVRVREQAIRPSKSKSTSSCGARTQRGGRERPLRSHFLSSAYCSGYDMDTAGTGYTLQHPDPEQGRGYSFYRHVSTGIVVASQALHLAPFGSPDLDVVYHYASDRFFHEICSSAKVSGRQWEGLRSEGPLCGKFVYAIGIEPKQVASLDVLAGPWPKLANCCLPLVLPRAWLVRGSCVRPKVSLLGDLEQLPALDVCIVRCVAESRALACAASCALQRQRSFAARCREKKGIEDLDTLSALSQLASMLEKGGEAGEAERCYREALKGHEQHFGASHLETMKLLCRFAQLQQGQGQLEQAESSFRRLSECYEVQLGPFHVDTLLAYSHLTAVLEAQGKLSEAELLHRQTLSRREQAFGPEDPATLQSVSGLADLLEAEGRLEEAETLQRRVLAWNERTLGDFHADSIRSLSRLARLLEARGELGEAECLFRRALTLTREQFGDSHMSTLMREDSLAAVFVSQGELAMAASAYWNLLEGKEASLGREHAETLATVGTLAELLEAQGELEQAEALYLRVHAGHASRLGWDHPKSVTSAGRLATLARKIKSKSKSKLLGGKTRTKSKAQGMSDDLSQVFRLLQSHLAMLGAGQSEAALIVSAIERFSGAPCLSLADGPPAEGAERVESSYPPEHTSVDDVLYV